MNLIDLIRAYSKASFYSGLCFGQEKIKEFKKYSHEEAELFEKIQRIVQGLESRDESNN